MSQHGYQTEEHAHSFFHFSVYRMCEIQLSSLILQARKLHRQVNAICHITQNTLLMG